MSRDVDVDWRLLRHYLACRAGHRCEICGVLLGAGQEGTVHHRLPRGMGGTSDPDVHRLDRLMLLCGGALGGVKGCHGYVEANGALALANGWKVPHGAGPAADTMAVPVLLYSGRRVLLDPYGPFYLPYRETL
jgi:hypothetical protein